MRPATGALFVACALALAATVGGCGGGHRKATGTDPALAVPSHLAPLFIEADVRPEGAEREAALKAGRALTHRQNPYLGLLAALRTPGSPPLDYSRDIAPWLGPHAGVFLASLGSAQAVLSPVVEGMLGRAPVRAAFPFALGPREGAFLLDASDVSRARSFLNRQAARAGAAPGGYRGVPIRVTSGGIGFALVDRLVVIGSGGGVRDAIDSLLTGESLGRNADYVRLRHAAPVGELAHAYLNPGLVPPGEAVPSALLALLTGGRKTDVSLVPAPKSITLVADGLPAAGELRGGLLSSGREEGAAFAGLPGDSWLAVGLAHLGETLAADVAGLKELASLGTGLSGSGASGAGTVGLGSLVNGLLAAPSALGANTPAARRDFQRWMGSGGIFAGGASILELKGAIVIESHDAALSRAAVGKLAGQLRAAGDSVRTVSVPGAEAAVSIRVPGLPLPLVVADGQASGGGSRFVLALGESSVAAALSPASRLASSSTRAAAASALGEGIQPSIYLEVPTLLGLLEGVNLTEDPTLAPLVPYLRSITVVEGGGTTTGTGIERFRLRIGLR